MLHARAIFIIGVTSLYFLTIPVYLISEEFVEDGFLRIERTDFECVRDNLSVYLDYQEPPFVIVFPGCPEPDPDRALLSLLQNNMFDRDPSIDEIAEISHSFTIIAKFSLEELKCFASHEPDPGKDVLVFSRSLICE